MSLPSLLLLISIPFASLSKGILFQYPSLLLLPSKLPLLLPPPPLPSLKINSVPTKPIEGWKTGTNGLRKKVKVFIQENCLPNWIQAFFNSLPPEDYKNGMLVLGGDGRYFSREA